MNLGDPNLRPIRLLGKGTFGCVFLCICRKGGNRRRLCVKRITVQNAELEYRIIQEEVYILSQLDHPHIVKFIRSFVHDDTVNIVMEYLANGTIRDIINQMKFNGHLCSAQLMSFFLDMLMGLEYLHTRHVTHRDIKPENLLLDKNYRVKYADFGISGIHHDMYKVQIKSAGTPLYSAPEVLRNEHFDYKSDIWSLGCVCYELCKGHNPFILATNIEHLNLVIRLMTKPYKKCPKIHHLYGYVFGHLCERMLTFDLRQRISLSNIISFDASITLPFYRRYFNYDYRLD